MSVSNGNPGQGGPNDPEPTSDLNRLKEELVVAKSDWNTLFHYMAQGVVYHNSSGEITNANPAAERILGLTLDQMQGRTSIDPRWKSIHEDGSDFPGETHPAVVALSAGKPIQDVVMGVFNPLLNELRWISINAVPNFLDGEKTPFQVYATFDDITDFHTTREELRKVNDEQATHIELISQSEKKLTQTVRDLNFQKFALDEHAIVSIADVKGNITYVNDKFCEISGYSREELMGQNHRMVKSDEHSPAFYKDLWGTIANGKTWNGNIKNLKKDGQIFWVAATIIPYLEERGKPFQYVAIRTDVTARIRAEEGLRRTQKMEAIGELTGGIAHDFNNLLGIIIGNLDLISRKMESGGKLQKQLEKAQKAALRGAALTKRLLNFSSHSAEAHSPVNVSKVVDEFEELIRKSLTVNIAVEIHCADDLWMVDLNPDDFEDALINLSLNARDAMPKGGSLIIEVNNTILDGKFTEFEEGLEPGQYVEIAVSDAGTGMSKVVADKIFDPFFTTKDKDKGTGLGLAMVYGFVQRTRGHITVYSEVGEGTTFRMYLPRSMSQAECAENSARIVGSLPEGTETVLIVDDEEELAAVAESILNGLGYTTICTHSGHEAQQVLGNNNTIDLVFSDVVMPGGMSGFDLANIIDEEYPNVKILLTSGFTGKTKQAGLAGELTQKMVMKPYRDIELATRVRETLDEVR